MFFAACSTPIRLKITNQENSNLNTRGDNVPVTLIIYQLKDIKKFENAPINDLITREEVVLGKDRIDSARMQVPPNSNDKIAIEINKKEAKYIGVLALFANQQDKKGKIYKKINKVLRNSIKIMLSKDGIDRY